MGRPTTIGKLTAYHHATYGNLSHLTPLSGAELLAPAEPGKVIAIGFNYGRHLGDSERAQNPGVFIKLPSAIVGTGAEIVYPEGASNVHFEGEFVLVIGKTASRLSKEEAADYIFGITAGNDVSERDWQRDDLQWFRAKASHTTRLRALSERAPSPFGSPPRA